MVQQSLKQGDFSGLAVLPGIETTYLTRAWTARQR